MSIALSPGEEAVVGRRGEHLSVPQDSHMSATHFRLVCDPSECRVRDLNSSNGTFLNGNRITDALLTDGDRILAGRTTFAVRVEEPPVLLQESAPRGVLETLQGYPEPLYAVLDAARDRAVLPLLLDSGEKFQSLYEGEKGEELASVAPYLVALPSESELLKILARDAWGRSWGVYLNCGLPFRELRHHLRRFLTVKLESGREVNFRFYDPRVLGTFLPTCNREQSARFFGPITRFLLESGAKAIVIEVTPVPHGTESPGLLRTSEAHFHARDVDQAHMKGFLEIPDVDHFTNAQTARANEGLVDYLRQRFPDQFRPQPGEALVEFVHAARTKARRFGIEREDNVATFLDLTVMYPGFPEVPWAQDVLNANTLHGPDRIAMLLERIRRQGVEI